MAAVDLSSKVDALERAIAPLERSFDRIELFLFAATALVVVGLVVEYWDDAHRVIERIRKKRPIPWHIVRLVAGAVLVTVGVAWELVEEIQAADVETRLRTDSDGVIQLLTTASNNSMGLIAASNERAHEADEKAESERLKRAQLEKQFAPRRLDLDQMGALERALAPFSGKTVLVRSYALDIDGAMLATQLIDALKAAHLTPVDGRASLSGVGSFATGVHISGNEPLGVAVAESLNGDDIGVVFEPKAVPFTGLMTGPAGTNADATIFVGVKPLPY